MGKYLGQNCRLYINGYEIGSIIESLTPNPEVELHPYAVMDGSGGYHQLRGLHNDTLELDGLFDDNYQGVLASLREASTGYAVLIPFGVSSGCKGLAHNEVKLSDLKMNAVVTDINRISAKLMVENDYFEDITVISAFDTKTDTGEGSSIDEDAESSDGASAYLQITSLGADETLEVKIQESSDDGDTDAWSDLITFTTLDGAVATSTAEKKAVSGTVERYIRAVWTFSGSSPYAGSFILGWKRN
ncbi:hypothetical protein [Dehalococcoides sp.]|jgi:hypothetical protein|uniref:hypothetical protein n=1 Tax=Dehalococcoides sp. TaxID=1966486 RepID=UPI00356778AD